MANTGTSTVTVFDATRWLDDLCNSRARAVGPDLIEWECTTWGSGRGGGCWEDLALFCVIAERFELNTYRNRDERDEIVVQVPLNLFQAVSDLIERLGDEAESWPWMDEEDEDRRIRLAAEVLDLKPEELDARDWLLEVGRIIYF